MLITSHCHLAKPPHLLGEEGAFECVEERNVVSTGKRAPGSTQSRELSQRVPFIQFSQKGLQPSAWEDISCSGKGPGCRGGGCPGSRLASLVPSGPRLRPCSLGGLSVRGAISGAGASKAGATAGGQLSHSAGWRAGRAEGAAAPPHPQHPRTPSPAARGPGFLLLCVLFIPATVPWHSLEFPGAPACA